MGPARGQWAPLKDNGPHDPAQDEDGAGEVVPDDVDKGMVHLEELLPGGIRKVQLFI